MRRKIPPLQALACFESAAKHQSYTRAAQELSLTQGAVSRQIAALEDYLGTTLFDRTRHGMSLTEAGQRYARQIAPRLVGLESDTRELMAHRGGVDSLHIATVPTFATRWLLPRLGSLQVMHPDLMVHLDVKTRPFLFDETPFDAALYAGRPDQVASWPGTHLTHLMAEDVVPVASPQLLGSRTRLVPADIAKLPLLQASTRPDAWARWFQAAGLSDTNATSGPRYELFSMLTVAASQGLGVALLPTMFIDTEVAEGKLVVLSAKPLKGLHSYWLVTPQRTVPNPVTEKFRSWLLTQVIPV